MQVVATINLFFSGILTGIEIAVHYGFRQPAALLDTKPQIVLRKGLVRKLRWLVPLFFFPALITGLIMAIPGFSGSLFGVRLAAIAALCIWLCIRITGTVKINAASLDWNPDRPPADWREQIDRAELFHIIGTWLTVIAFVCFLVSATELI